MQLPVNKMLCHFLGILGFPTIWEKSVGSVLFRRSATGNREYLLLQYPSGHFDFPRGHVDSGETEEATLRRETLEETGISELTVFPKRLSTKFFYRARGNEYERRRTEGRGTWIFKEVHLYPAETEGLPETTLSHEHTSFVWLPFDQALDKVTFENAKNVLQAAEDYLRHET